MIGALVLCSGRGVVSVMELISGMDGGIMQW